MNAVACSKGTSERLMGKEINQKTIFFFNINLTWLLLQCIINNCVIMLNLTKLYSEMSSAITSFVQTIKILGYYHYNYISQILLKILNFSRLFIF